MSFDKFWFKPEHQPNKETPVEFELKPLDHRSYCRLQTSTAHADDPAWRDAIQEDCERVYLANVSSWRGLETPYTPDAKRQVLSNEGNMSWSIWVGEIAGQLYMRALLKEPERKNS